MSNSQLNDFGERKKNSWYKNAIVNFCVKKEKAVVATGLAFVFCAAIRAQTLIWNKTFNWVDVEPFSTLSWDRVLFSAITFLTIGEILFRLYFYKALSFFFHTILNDHRGYIEAKRWIWRALMLFMYFYVQPIVIKFLNVVTSILYNIIAFLAFSLPTLGITLLFLIGYLLIRRLQTKR
jgi:hypothetical protein